MAAEQIIALAASTPTELNRTPFIAQTPAHFNSVPGATVYGVNLPGRDARDGDYQRFLGDGTTTFDEDAIINLANAHLDGGALTDADNLKVVIFVEGVLFKRVSSVGSPGAGEFTCADSGGKATVEFGTAPATGAKIEVFLSDAVTQTITLTANVPAEHPTSEIMLASAAAQVIRVG